MAAEDLAFTKVNHARIKAVERSFGPCARPLGKPGRVLLGEGRLLKRSRRGVQPKVFFLFSDVLVYGTVVASCRWYKNRRIVRLEDIELVDHEDSAPMLNHWLIRTPRKSFYVAAGCPEEKQAWMEHIVASRDRLRQGVAHQPSSTIRPFSFAPTWIPDQASAVCMRCPNKFSFTQRRHHCRNCGFVVCAACSKQHAMLPHIHHREPQRVCKRCHTSLKGKERAESMGNSRGENLEVSEEEEE